MAHRPRISGDTVETLNQIVDVEVDGDVDAVGIDERIQALIAKHKRVVTEMGRLQLELQHQQKQPETASNSRESKEYHPPSDGFMK